MSTFAGELHSNWEPADPQPTSREVATVVWSNKSRMLAVVAAAAVGLAAAGCSSGSSSSKVAASAKQTIVFAESGLGTEGQQTQVAINAFEKANPNIKVSVDVLSPNSTTYLSQLEQTFTAGSSTPDLFESDVTYPPNFAQAGLLPSLNPFHPALSHFFPHEAPSALFHGAPDAVPWSA